MRILLVHNYYGSGAPSGENRVFEAERALLAGRGHAVAVHTRSNDELNGGGDRIDGGSRGGEAGRTGGTGRMGGAGRIGAALAAPWNEAERRRVRRLLWQERPAVMHVHNTFPLLSPAVFRAARGTGAATVLTLHNYRTFCAAGVPLRDGRPCIECLDRRSSLPALRWGCYRNSRLATLPAALMVALHRRLGTWQRDVDAFIALTAFQRDRLTAAGLPAEKVHVKPHFPEGAPAAPVPWAERTGGAVCLGRLSHEKGVAVLVEAWVRLGAAAPPLEIVGDGPDRAALEQRAAAGGGGRIIFTGQLPFAEAQARLARSRLLVLPSVCFEGFPMSIAEAFAAGVPVAASALGSMTEIVGAGQGGVLVPPGDAAALAAAVSDLWRAPERLAALGATARVEYEAKYTADASYARMMEIYGLAVEGRKRLTD